MPEFSFTGTCKLTLRHDKGMTASKHVATDFRLDVSGNLEKEMYLDEDDLPTKEGVKPLTQAFIQGLVGNIHMAHEKGFWDSAAHLRYVIEKLQEGFATVAHTSKAEM